MNETASATATVGSPTLWGFFIGAKLLLMGVLKIPPLLSLAVILAVLGSSIGWSLHKAKRG